MRNRVDTRFSRVAALAVACAVAVAVAAGTLTAAIDLATATPSAAARPHGVHGAPAADSETTARLQASGPHEYGCPIFPASYPLNREIAHAPVSRRSAAYIESIGRDVHLHPDFGRNPDYGIPYAVVPRDQRKVAIHFTAYGAESNRGPYPVPANAPVEGGRRSSGDRHVLVLDVGRAGSTSSTTPAAPRTDGMPDPVRCSTCGATRCVPKAGPPLTPPGCRSSRCSRATGRFAPAASTTLRVTVPETQRGYIHPATHYASSSADPSLPPMGLRLRLKTTYSLKGFSRQARVILTALKRYGLVVADNGSPWYITGAPSAHWNQASILQIERVSGSDFEAVSSGPIHR